MSSIFIINPFGVAGDRAVVPMDATLSGTVSFEIGFGPRYELDQKTDPDALAVPRDETNYILYALSLGLQQYQTLSAPDFIKMSDNDGSAYSYSKGVKTRFEYSTGLFRYYESLKDANTDTPATPASWRWVDNDAGKLTVDNATFNTTMGSAVVNGDAVYWDGGNSWFAQAVANGTGRQEVVGIADVTNNRVFLVGSIIGFTSLTPGAVYYLSPSSPGAITTTLPVGNAVRVGVAKDANTLFFNPAPEVADTGVPTGTSIVFRGFSAPAGYLLEDKSAVSRTTYASLFNVLTFTRTANTTSGSAIVTGLLNTNNIFAGNQIEGTGIPAATTVVSVDSSSQITLSANATATGSPTLRVFPYGNGDGSTTFNVPDSRRRVDVGSGGSGSSIVGNLPAQAGGEEAHALTSGENGPHVHGAPDSDPTAKYLLDSSTTVGLSIGTGDIRWNESSITGTSGSGTPHNTMQPSLIATKAIKY